MSKRVYISADYDLNNGDRDVVDELNKWGIFPAAVPVLPRSVHPTSQQTFSAHSSFWKVPDTDRRSALLPAEKGADPG